jgi:hypothetical protein
MAESGMRTMWNGIHDDNLPSQRAHARAGFRPVLRVTAVLEPPPGRLRIWVAGYADERLVVRTRQMLRAVGRAAAPTGPNSRRRRARRAA